MPDKSTAELWSEAEAATAAHAAAVKVLAEASGWHARMSARDNVISAHLAKVNAIGRWWTAAAGEPTEDAIEARVYRAADVLSPKLYAGVSPTDLAWELEEAGVLK